MTRTKAIDSQRCSVADELEYDALPVEVRELAEKVLGDKESIFNAGYSQGYSIGYRNGKQDILNEDRSRFES